MIALISAHDGSFGLIDILLICVPATFCGCMIGALSVWRKGRELKDDPEYQKRLKDGLIKTPEQECEVQENRGAAATAIWIFAAGVLGVVLLGIFPDLRPSFQTESGRASVLGMAPTIEIVMLSSAALIMLATRSSSTATVSSSVMRAGLVAVISILGIAWLGSTFFSAHETAVVGEISQIVKVYPWVFSVGLFALSILLYSQAATVAALMHVGVSLEIPIPLLIAMFPAVNGYFFLPTYGTIVAAISFDQTGTTTAGRYLLDHSFMRPGIVATIGAITIGLAIAELLY
jgi:anaerobic C4-dicarboxylate transporter DcuA